MRRPLLSLCAVFFTCSASFCAEPAAKPAFDVTQTALGALPDRVTPAQVIISPDGLRYAYIKSNNFRFTPVVDGKTQKTFDWIVNNLLVFSADSQHLVYLARTPHAMRMVLDGEPQKEYETIDDWAFGPTGRLGYCAKSGDKYTAVIDGKETGPYQRVRIGALPIDGPPALIVGDETGEALVTGGVRGRTYEHVYGVRLADEGQRIVYRAVRQGKQVIVTDGEESRTYDELGPPAIAPPDHVAYTGKRNGQYYFAVDGAESRAYDLADLAPPIFSIDGEHVFCSATRAGKVFAIIDGGETAAWTSIHPGAQFSPDSEHLLYVASDAKQKSVLVVDKTLSPKYDAIPFATFSPDAMHVAYIAVKGSQSVVVIDGKELGKAADEIGPPVISFSPDCEHAAWIARRGRFATLVIDGEEAASFDDILTGGQVAIDEKNVVHCFAAVQRMDIRDPTVSHWTLVKLEVKRKAE